MENNDLRTSEWGEVIVDYAGVVYLMPELSMGDLISGLHARISLHRAPPIFSLCGRDLFQSRRRTKIVLEDTESTLRSGQFREKEILKLGTGPQPKGEREIWLLI
ncbi:hypothetical protein TIFTF001_037014 [Ficus carica]|uniref:Uncharacterized protein n=1 Tax=Ficus carica TaxID=3494 RepID=A0AA88JBN8_FICCA|nr:hypothetical protein TIFTF001_037014 [Ficus carica]